MRLIMARKSAFLRMRSSYGAVYRIGQMNHSLGTRHLLNDFRNLVEREKGRDEHAEQPYDDGAHAFSRE
jgi:hypothetical protein